MSEAKKYDRSYMEQSVKPVLEIGLKRTGEGLKIAYGTLYGWVQAAKNGIYTDTTKTKKSQRTQKYPQYVMDMLWELRKEQDEQCAGIGDKWQDYDHLFIKWDGSPMNNNTPYFWFKEFCEKNSIRFCDIHSLRHPYVKHTTKIFSLRLMDFQAQAYPDARRKTRGACQLHRGGQSQSPVRPLCNRKRFS